LLAGKFGVVGEFHPAISLIKQECSLLKLLPNPLQKAPKLLFNLGFLLIFIIE